MPTPSHRPARTPLHARPSVLARTAAAVVLAGGLVATAALPAQAAEGSVAAPATAAAPSAAADAVLATAAQHVGAPYAYGGTTPAGFDCSGFTGFVFGQHGIGLQRTADAQMRSTRHVPAAEAAPGDLVFFVGGGGRAYHAAIYAGNGWIYDASSSGGAVTNRPMWSDRVVYARVLA